MKQKVMLLAGAGQIGMAIAAGVSPSQAPIETILKVDLYGSALMMEEVGKVIAEGGSGIMISSQSGFRMPALNYGALKPEK
jgi:hypothetical protein